MADKTCRIYEESLFFDEKMKIEIRKMIKREGPQYLQLNKDHYLVRLNSLPPALIDRLYNYVIAKQNRQFGP